MCFPTLTKNLKTSIGKAKKKKPLEYVHIQVELCQKQATDQPVWLDWCGATEKLL